MPHRIFMLSDCCRACQFHLCVLLPFRYGHEHAALELQKEAVYGLTEIYRDQVKSARLLANPGCYPTCSQLGLYPLLKVRRVVEARRWSSSEKRAMRGDKGE